MSIDKDGKLKKLFETFETLTTDSSVETTVPDDDDHPIVVNEPKLEEPIEASPISMRQPTEFDKYEQLPVDQQDYVPSTPDELGRACRIIMRKLPQEKVAATWKKINQLIDKSSDDAMIMRDGFEKTQEDSKMKNESHFRKVIRQLIKESGYGRRKWDTTTQDGPSMDDLDAIERGLDTDTSDLPEIPLRGKGEKYATMGFKQGDYDMLQSLARQVEDDPADVAAEEDEAEEIRRRKYVTAGEEGMSLKDIASKMGYAGPSGVKNLLYVIEDKVKYFASLDEVWFRDMMREFARAYVEELLDAGGKNLNKKDVQFLSDVLADPEELDVIASEEGFRIWAQEGLNKVYKSRSGKMSK